MLVVQDKRLVQLDELFGAQQVALLLGQRRFFHPQNHSYAIDSRDNRFLHGNGQPLIALLGHRDGFKFYFEPVLDALLRSVMLAVRQSG